MGQRDRPGCQLLKIVANGNLTTLTVVARGMLRLFHLFLDEFDSLAPACFLLLLVWDLEWLYQHQAVWRVSGAMHHAWNVRYVVPAQASQLVVMCRCVSSGALDLSINSTSLPVSFRCSTIITSVCPSLLRDTWSLCRILMLYNAAKVLFYESQ